MAFTARKKIVKERGAEPDDLEEQVAQVRAMKEKQLAWKCSEFRLVGSGTLVRGRDWHGAGGSERLATRATAWR